MKPQCQLARKRQTGSLLLRPPLHVLYIFPVGNPAPCTLWGAVRLYLLPVRRSEPRPDLLNPVLPPGFPLAKQQPDNQKLARSSPARCGLGLGRGTQASKFLQKLESLLRRVWISSFTGRSLGKVCLPDGSQVRRESPARFCERLGVRLPRAYSPHETLERRNGAFPSPIPRRVRMN
jgi:hypothetical protein